MRRIVDISEVRKHWTKDPLEEKGFFKLMEYDTKKDMLVPTPQLMEGESEVIKDIASRVRDWVGHWDRVWENIAKKIGYDTNILKENILPLASLYALAEHSRALLIAVTSLISYFTNTGKKRAFI